MTDFRKQWNYTCKAAGLVSIGKDTAAKLLAIVYVLRRNPNDFIVSFPYCGFCHKKLYKKYKVAEEAVIVISSKQNAVIEILPKDDFVPKYIEKKK